MQVLSSNYKDCNHSALKDYNDWLCQESKTNFILCKHHNKHQAAQDWIKANFDPKLGRGNLNNCWKEFNNDTAIINSIQVAPDPQAEEIADIEEIMDDGDTAYVRAVLVN